MSSKSCPSAAKPGRSWLVLALCLALGAALGAAAVACRPAGPRSDMLLFILAGQSNMSGRGEVGRLPPGFPANRERIQVFNNAYQWCGPREPLDDPRGQRDLCSRDRAPGVGPGLAFAQRLSELMPRSRIGLIPCAKSDTTLAQWAPSPLPDTLYGSSLRRARAASQRGRVAGVLFFQGENDTASLAAAKSWPRRFAGLVAAWRRDLGDPALPVVFAQLGRLGAELRADPLCRHWRLLQQEQAALRLPNLAMVRADDLPLKPDGIHLSTPAQLRLGRRMAWAMHRLLTQGPGLAGQSAPRPAANSKTTK
ncbi:MAG: sialate O-acetylesterase [Desulfarculaceae bacterium]|nr:sialate O-acetylesterase [Desulfarculaceae bacterium]MCF8072652.1 sialate O-acetylesterase [Desulfarculaceae bacterium]MCF8102531.1 sialate O-acetylesterase [Desulfarculaceae bacterium]